MLRSICSSCSFAAHVFSFILFLSPSYGAQYRYGPPMTPIASQHHEAALFSFNTSWHLLGPFQIGTREATWGADPLEYVGGFRNLTFDPEATFRSSLPTNGTATWSVTHAVQTSDGPISANASLSIGFSNVDWDFLRRIYGWAAVQYQTWVRGELLIRGNETQHLILHTDAILEFWVDDVHYFGGDLYTFRKAPPVLHLKPGSHKIDIRLVRDVRAFGGILTPTMDVAVEVQQASGVLELAKPGILMSDVVNGTLASPAGSVVLRNSGWDDVEIVRIRPSNISEQSSDSRDGMGFVLVAGQTRPVAFNVSLPTGNASFVVYDITYRVAKGSHLSTLQVSQHLTHVSTHVVHRITFLHPGGMVSYAMLRPPPKNITCHGHPKKLPVLLSLHGAGVEVDNPDVTGVLDPVSDLCAWVLFPTGVTPWSGDDWHNWGFADVESAIEAIPAWIRHTGWKGPDVDITRWIVSGHSNGGQGTWYALTHRPDRIVAAAPVSGYASIQKYVTYELWQCADPRRTAVISASLNSYRHEMLMSNTRGIPIQQQHGVLDDNVPAYHSRYLAQQLYLAGSNSSYNEVVGQNHWWDTIMTTPELVGFYHTQTKNQDILPRKLAEFTIIVGDPGDMGSKCGIRVVRLKDPGQYGRVTVKGRTIRTANIQSLEFDPVLWTESLIVDGRTLDLDEAALASKSLLYAHSTSSGWSLVLPASDRHIRKGRQLGSMLAILRTTGPFIIRHQGSANTSHIALQVSRNLNQYFQADAIIAKSAEYTVPPDTTGNIITLAIGFGQIVHASAPILIKKSGVSVVDHNGEEQQYGDRARSTAYLRPVAADSERLELVLWGADDEGLRQAARIMPMLTGVGQPDFVVLDESAKWRGIEGALAMGFFDSHWKVTASSVVEGG